MSAAPNSTASAAHAHARLVPIAPAINVGSGPQQQQQQQLNDGQEPELMPYTCVTCARRKVKCDKTKPCSACRKGRLECSYQAPPPRKRKRKNVEDIHERLERYERILRTHNLLLEYDEVEESPESHDGTHIKSSEKASPDPLTAPPAQHRTGKLLSAPGKTRYVDSNIWSNLGEELHPSSDEEDADYGPPELPDQIPEPIDPITGALLGISHYQSNLADFHPPYDMAMKLWNIYAHHIDPIIKVVHVPTGQKLMEYAAANPDKISKNTECLVFAIYHFAIIAMEEAECQVAFGQPWSVLEKKYYEATRNALVSCSFLKTTELVVLQAYMLLLMSMKNRYDPHTYWVLTGVAVRLAQRMGLHRDGEELGLKPFDVQMRRRIFWQLLPLDGLASQLAGTGIAISSDSWDTKQPLNVNDEDIWPEMTETPQEKKTATDMIFCLARTEVGRFHQKVKPGLGAWARVWEVKDIAAIEQALNDLENVMEEKYIRYCDIASPIHCLTMAMARSALGSARLRIRLPRSQTHGALPEERKDMHAVAKKILDHSISIHRNANLSRFMWHLRSFFQWDPLIWVLKDLRHPDGPIVSAEECWRLIGAVFDSQPRMLSRNRSLDIAVARLTLKAWEHTQATRSIPLPDPPYIIDRKEFFARREASRQGTQTLSPQSSTQTMSGEVSNDVPAQNYYNSDIAAGFMNFNMPGDFNDIDWMFWEELAPNSSAFPTTMS